MASLNNFTYLKDCDNAIALYGFKTWEPVQKFTEVKRNFFNYNISYNSVPVWFNSNIFKYLDCFPADQWIWLTIVPH